MCALILTYIEELIEKDKLHSKKDDKSIECFEKLFMKACDALYSNNKISKGEKDNALKRYSDLIDTMNSNILISKSSDYNKIKYIAFEISGISDKGIKMEQAKRVAERFDGRK